MDGVHGIYFEALYSKRHYMRDSATQNEETALCLLTLYRNIAIRYDVSPGVNCNESESMWNEAVEVLSRHFPERWRKPRNLSIGLALSGQ
jgi:hypothetical protein